ncbi:hypothetical protein GCM10008905_32800 [Clostridium malenominatum]|uniref:Uncharacterized protein n=1 Tax=Clostridium malenominatum TaxID=1539 RepID=A0ABP3UDC2_9CLOT
MYTKLDIHNEGEKSIFNIAKKGIYISKLSMDETMKINYIKYLYGNIF